MEVVVKKKAMMHCADCGAEMAAGMDKCPDCGSMDIKKSLIIIRKETADVDEELEPDDVDDSDDDESDEDDDSDDDDSDDDDSDDDDEESDDDEDEVPPLVAKSLTSDGKKIAFVEALNLSTALAESVTNILSTDVSKAAESYESVMTEFNAVMDSAFDQWVTGSAVSKADNLEEQTTLITNRVNNIIKEGGAAMPKKITRPESLDTAELSDEVQAYITALESGAVEKSGESEEEDIFKGLSPKVAEIVKRAELTNEQAEAQKYIDVAKGFTHIPGDKVELAKSLRHSSETDEDGYKVLISTLTATNENLKDSSVFKSFGKPGSGDKDISKHAGAAAELVSKGLFKTIEQAEVSLMGADDYVPSTN